MPQIIHQLGKLEHTHRPINLAKTIVMLLILTLLGHQLLSAGSFSTITLLSFGWIFLSTLVFLIYYWRVQFQLEKLDFQRSSREFLQQAISRLQQQIDFFGRPFRIYAFLLVLGVNGTASEIWQESSPGEIIGFHAAATAILLLVIIAGIKFRQWRFRKEIDPLVEEMQALIKAQDE